MKTESKVEGKEPELAYLVSVKRRGKQTDKAKGHP